MPKPTHKKVLLYTAGVLLAVFALLAPTIFYQLPTADLHIAGKTVTLEVASAATQGKGLGGRKSMAIDHGMVLVLAQPAKQCVAMKDMRFPLDIVWVSAGKQVMQMQQNVSPRTYPKQFCPDSPAKYVVELNAGQASVLGVRTGQTLKF